MSAIASSRVERWLFPGWVAFATANIALMFVMPGKETIPFHFVWISLSIVYGLQPWSLRRTYVVLAAVCLVTGAALLRHVQNDVIGWEETTEVPLMSMVFLAMVWHVRQRAAAIAEARALAESERRVRDAQRRFVRFASHDLRTPVTIARGYTELIGSQTALAQVREDVAIVMDELDKLERIASRLLTLAQINEQSSLRPASVDLDALLHRTIKRWHVSANRHWWIDTDAGFVIADAERLEAVLDSLLDNAVRYTSSKDSVADPSEAAPAWDSRSSRQSSTDTAARCPLRTSPAAARCSPSGCPSEREPRHHRASPGMSSSQETATPSPHRHVESTNSARRGHAAAAASAARRSTPCSGRSDTSGYPQESARTSLGAMCTQMPTPSHAAGLTRSWWTRLSRWRRPMSLARRHGEEDRDAAMQAATGA